MADTLQTRGNRMLAQAPSALLRALHNTPVQFQQFQGDPVSASRGGVPVQALAGVRPHDASHIQVIDPLAVSDPQFATHEATHIAYNNLHPALLARQPKDNPQDPYNYGGDAGIAALVRRGGTMADLPQEAGAAAMQHYQVEGGDSNPKMAPTYGKLASTFDTLPQSPIMPTNPGDQELNTRPRAPRPPPSTAPGMYMAESSTKMKKGDPAPGGWEDVPSSSGQHEGAAAGGWEDVPAAGPRSPTLHQQLQANTEPLSTDTGHPLSNLSHFGQNILRRGARTLGTPVADLLESSPSSRPPLPQVMDHDGRVTTDSVSRGLEGSGLDYGTPMRSLVQRLHEFGQEYHHDPNLAVSNAIGDAGAAAATTKMVAGAPEVVQRGAMAGARAAEGTGDFIANRAVGAQPEDFELGANPGRAIRSGRMVGTSKPSLSRQVKAAIPQASDARNAILDRSTAPPSDVTGPVNDPFNATTARTTNPRTGVVQPGQQRSMITMQRAINEVSDPQTGAPSGTPKDLTNLTPREISDLASNIYQSTDYSTPDNTLANSALKQAGYGLKQQLDTVAPEAAPMTQNLHDLMQAKDTLANGSQGGGGIPTSKAGALSSLVKRGVMGGATTASAAADLVGSGLRRVAGGGQAPPPMAGAAPGAATPPPPQPGQYPPTAGGLQPPAGPGAGLATQPPAPGAPPQPPSMAQTLLAPTMAATSTPRALPGVPPRLSLPAEAVQGRPGVGLPPPVNPATARTTTATPPPDIDRSIPARSYTAAPDGSVTITRPALQPPGAGATGVPLAKQVQAGKLPMTEQPIPASHQAPAGGSTFGGPAANGHGEMQTQSLLDQVLGENAAKTNDQGIKAAKAKGRISWNGRRQVGG